MMNQNCVHNLRNSKELILKESEQLMMICFCSSLLFVNLYRRAEQRNCNCFHVYVNSQPLCFHHAVPLETIEKYQMTFTTFCLNFYLHSWRGTQEQKVEHDGDLLLVASFFFVVVTNFEALCFHRNLPRRDDEVCYSPAGFFSSKMKTNWRLFSFPIPPEKAAMNSFVSGIH